MRMKAVIEAALSGVESLWEGPALWDDLGPVPSPRTGTRPSRYFVSGSTSADYGRRAFSCYVDEMLPSPWTRQEKRLLERAVQGHVAQEPQGEPQGCCEYDIPYRVPWEEVARQVDSKDARECFMMYTNEVDPKINETPWTEEENKRLLDLVLLYEEHDWVSIAHELRTHRTPMQCLQHYQRCLNLSLARSDDWSPEEMQTLREAVAMYGERNWQHVANSLPGRSMRQVMSRWRKVRDAEKRTGPYSNEEEKRLFLAAIALEVPTLSLTKRKDDEISAFDNADDSKAIQMLREGRQVKKRVSKQRTQPEEDNVEDEEPGATSTAGMWMQLSRLVQGRDEVQVREKWFRDVDPTVYRNIEFTEDEDARLLRMVRLIGPGNWTVCAEWLPGRPDDQVLRRWERLTSIKYNQLNFHVLTTFHT